MKQEQRKINDTKHNFYGDDIIQINTMIVDNEKFEEIRKGLHDGVVTGHLNTGKNFYISIGVFIK